MAKRFTDTAIWNKEWFMDLSPTHKCLIRYLFDNCDPAGVWKPNWKLASLHIGENVNELSLNSLPAHQYEILPNGKIFLPDFIKFQYSTLSDKSPAHKPVFLAIEKNNLSDRVFGRVLNTLQEKDKVKEIEKEEEKETEKDFGKSENLLALAPQMLVLWKNTFPKYSADQHHDFPACKQIADFIFKSANVVKGYGNTNEEIKALNTFQLIADQVNREPFWTNKPLKSIANNIQEFYNKIKNPINGHASKNGKQNGKINDDLLKQKLAERAPKGYSTD
jgi:hypothetical protein